METERLTNIQAESRKFKVVNKPLHEMSLKTQVQVTSLLKREPLMKACGKSVFVRFANGPLGLQLADVGRRVLITAFENDEEGQPGQAERCGKLEVGYQIVGIAGRSCLGLPMKALLVLLEETPRPVTMEFQPLIIPRFPSKDKATIYDQIGPNMTLEMTGEPYELFFGERFLGLNVGCVDKMVVVSQFMDGASEEIQAKVSLGDRIIALKAKKNDDDEWVTTNTEMYDYSDLAALVRDSGRPIRLVFHPTKVVPKSETKKVNNNHDEEPKVLRNCRSGSSFTSAESSKDKKLKKKKKSSKGSKETVVCSKCSKKGPQTAKFCWKCGTPVVQQQQTIDLLDLDGPETEEDLDLFGSFHENEGGENDSTSSNSRNEDTIHANGSKTKKQVEHKDSEDLFGIFE